MTLKITHGSDLGPVWIKSSYSTPSGPDCIEVAATASAVRVRDSTDPEGPRLSFTPEAWAAFVAYAAGRAV